MYLDLYWGDIGLFELNSCCRERGIYSVRGLVFIVWVYVWLSGCIGILWSQHTVLNDRGQRPLHKPLSPGFIIVCVDLFAFETDLLRNHGYRRFSATFFRRNTYRHSRALFPPAAWWPVRVLIRALRETALNIVEVSNCHWNKHYTLFFRHNSKKYANRM